MPSDMPSWLLWHWRRVEVFSPFRYNCYMSTREALNTIAARRVLVLDGAMGSMIQTLALGETDFRGERFAGHATALAGCNDLLCLTKPEAIAGIHEAYLEAGADIIETCSFNSTAPSLADYGLDGALAYEISVAAAKLARSAADKFSCAQWPRFVAGSMGPGAKSTSLSPDASDPAKKGIRWDELEAACYDNARGLLDGGADILIVETVFDTLNAKAALFAIGRLLEERNIDVPVIISATVSGDSGRLLSGQTLEAFCASVLHARPWAIGLNCSFGAEKLLPHARALASLAPTLVSAHPNAGLPNRFGDYDETPETMAALIDRYLQEGLLNIVGGCCGSTPAHIAAIAQKAAARKPRAVPRGGGGKLALAGLEALSVGSADSLTIIGERANVAGSKKFLRLISEEKYGETLAFVRAMIDDGAAAIAVGMDDAMLDAEKSMCAFLDFALADPEIAKVPIMLDSSRWNVLEAGLKRLQGKGLVNSLTLKDGETEFLRRASVARRYGAAIVVMLIDEKGQAVSYARKIEIAGRAYALLVGSGFRPEDIVFDPNVLAVATGIDEHDLCALDFIRACAWIRENCPGSHVSGGVSNLSYSFRGNNAVREAMHSVFLKLAHEAGMTMAIANPAALVAYDEIAQSLRVAVEDVILNRDRSAADRLLALAERIGASSPGSRASGKPAANDWRAFSLEKRIVHAMVKGIGDFIEADVLALHNNAGEGGGKSALEIVEGPLMDGMKEVGRLFDQGAMYLPQVIRSAGVMKKAAAALGPHMGKALASNDALCAKIILATVKGDVHDIGKNIVGVVLACNGYRIVDLGVMVPAEQIVEAAQKERASMIGLSALVSPSLDEMANVAREMERRGMKIPLLIGGAAASLVHTAMRLAPKYSGPVVYVPNAGQCAQTARALLSDAERPQFLRDLEKSYADAASRHEAARSALEIAPLADARAKALASKTQNASVAPKTRGLIDLNDYPLEPVAARVDWRAFLRAWEIGSSPRARSAPGGGQDVQEDALMLLERAKTEGLLRLRGVAGIFPAAAKGDDVAIDAGPGKGSQRLCFLRSQRESPRQDSTLCLADFLAASGDWLGFFALTSGFGAEEAASCFRASSDDYSALLLETLANALAEAFAVEVHHRIAAEWWGYAQAPDAPPRAQIAAGIRPAFGYSACPDHEDKRVALDLLEAEKRCGLRLTESAMIVPAASVCAMVFASPRARYFSVGQIGEDQLRDWAKRKGIPEQEARRRLGKR